MNYKTKKTRNSVISLKQKKTLKHILFFTFYTCFTTALVSFLTYISLVTKASLLENNLLEQSLQKTVKIFPVKPTTEDKYIEHDSPYISPPGDSASSSADVIFHGSRDKKKIALTFDAEMTRGMRNNILSGTVKSSFEKSILETLNKTHTQATIFLTGMWIQLYPEITTVLSNDPLIELASHSYTDTSFHGYCYGLEALPQTLRIEDIGATEKLLREHAGIQNKFFRFPGGCYAPDDVKLVNQANNIVVHWDVNGVDGFNTNTSQIIHNVVDSVQNGSIIILHLNGAPTAPKTAEALPAIISQLKAKGYEFVKVSELLDLPAELRVKN